MIKSEYWPGPFCQLRVEVVLLSCLNEICSSSFELWLFQTWNMVIANLQKETEHKIWTQKQKTLLVVFKIPDLMISTSGMIISWCFLAASRPCNIKILKYLNMSDSMPPITSTNSVVSLNGDVSKPKFLGDVDSMNPKSIWIKCPSLLSKMLPLCLKDKRY